ncbi:MAG: DUF899 domain-containing protein [Armatimonadetes bacterium]|nr:DUF899 domain-containing protein [Armatimonadota bacterium]
MNETATAHPPIASREEWLTLRKELLAEEKALTKEYDRLNAKRRRLPMVKVEKTYSFEGVDGTKTLEELFKGQTQLIVYHFMFDPTWETGCEGCTGYIDALADLSALPKRSVNFVVVSRAPLAKLQAYKKERGWTIDWYSSGESDFNYDFGVTLDPARGPITYNYKTAEELGELGKVTKVTEMPGSSVFFRIGHDVYHTYSTYARGGEALCDSYRLLDITPFGRQEDFEDSPAGWPQNPTYG